MTTLPIAFAAAALALGLASTAQAATSVRLAGAGQALHQSLVHKVGCYDDCEEYLEAVEEAREEAAAYAEEAAEEADEYGYRPRRAHHRVRSSAHSEKPASPAKAKSAEDSPKATPKSSDGKSKVAANAKAACKQYFPSIGQALSVPCE